MSNPICDMMGITYPVLLGGMLFIGRAKLAAAVSEAGGLGVIAAGSMKPDELKAEIYQIRNITDRPFGINIPVRLPHSAELVRIACNEKVRVVVTAAGDPSKYSRSIREKGVISVHVVPTVTHAIKACDAGVDVVVAEGSESGGYINREEVATMALVPQVVDAVSPLPVVAAGGIADARGMVAALALGASGIQMGTRFLATHECSISEGYRQALILAKDSDTVVVRGKKAAHRDIKSEVIERVISATWNPLIITPQDKITEFETGSQRKKAGGAKGGVRSAGQSVGLIHEILTIQEVIQNIIGETAGVLSAVYEKMKCD